MPILLAIDDDPSILHVLRYVFAEPAIDFRTATSATEGLAELGRQRPDAILLDINLPDLSGLEMFRKIQALNARVPVIFLTGTGTTATAIEAMQLGAFEYLLKEHMLEPSETDRLRGVVQKAFEISRLTHVPARVPGEAVEGETGDVLVGRSPQMQEVYKAIGRVASQDVTVLILGESGTGKELVARAIYQHSRRAQGPFLAINCAAIPEPLLESELFGHEKGAFTGADRRRIGKFEQCNGGTLFLDEIGDITPLTQVKLLRVLQERQFERVGGNETIPTDVRIIAATNRNLEALCAEGRFRGDLYYRLSVFTIQLPPLRERGNDLPLLVDHFIKRFNRELGKEVRRVAPETLDILRRAAWPGNIRELQSILKQALLRATGPVLVPDFLPPAVTPTSSGMPELHGSLPATQDWLQFVRGRLHAGSTELYSEWLSLLEPELLAEVLRFTGGNQVQASKTLGISRNNLRSKMRAYGLRLGKEPDQAE